MGLSLQGVQFLQGDHQFYMLLISLVCSFVLYSLLLFGWNLFKVNSVLTAILSPLFNKGKKQKINPNIINKNKNNTLINNLLFFSGMLCSSIQLKIFIILYSVSSIFILGAGIYYCISDNFIYTTNDGKITWYFYFYTRKMEQTC